MTDRPSNPIFTIGHSDHTIERFLVLVAWHRIDAIADVRTSPRSSLYPQFNRSSLSGSLAAAGMHYVFLGKELGARRNESECYVEGKAKYELIARLPSFNEGLQRLQSGAAKFRIALLCAEKDPLTCHRAILVCRHLRFSEFAISHIGYNGQLESQTALEERMLKAVGVNGKDLISSHAEAVEQAYDMQGERIAYARKVKTGNEKD